MKMFKKWFCVKSKENLNESKTIKPSDRIKELNELYNNATENLKLYKNYLNDKTNPIFSRILDIKINFLLENNNILFEHREYFLQDSNGNGYPLFYDKIIPFIVKALNDQKGIILYKAIEYIAKEKVLLLENLMIEKDALEEEISKIKDAFSDSKNILDYK